MSTKRKQQQPATRNRASQKDKEEAQKRYEQLEGGSARGAYEVAKKLDFKPRKGETSDDLKERIMKFLIKEETIRRKTTQVGGRAITMDDTREGASKFRRKEPGSVDKAQRSFTQNPPPANAKTPKETAAERRRQAEALKKQEEQKEAEARMNRELKRGKPTDTRETVKKGTDVQAARGSRKSTAATRTKTKRAKAMQQKRLKLMLVGQREQLKRKREQLKSADQDTTKAKKLKQDLERLEDSIRVKQKQLDAAREETEAEDDRATAQAEEGVTSAEEGVKRAANLSDLEAYNKLQEDKAKRAGGKARRKGGTARETPTKTQKTRPRTGRGIPRRIAPPSDTGQDMSGGGPSAIIPYGSSTADAAPEQKEPTPDPVVDLTGDDDDDPMLLEDIDRNDKAAREAAQERIRQGIKTQVEGAFFGLNQKSRDQAANMAAAGGAGQSITPDSLPREFEKSKLDRTLSVNPRVSLGGADVSLRKSVASEVPGMQEFSYTRQDEMLFRKTKQRKGWSMFFKPSFSFIKFAAYLNKNFRDVLSTTGNPIEFAKAHSDILVVPSGKITKADHTEMRIIVAAKYMKQQVLHRTGPQKRLGLVLSVSDLGIDVDMLRRVLRGEVSSSSEAPPIGRGDGGEDLAARGDQTYRKLTGVGVPGSTNQASGDSSSLFVNQQVPGRVGPLPVGKVKGSSPFNLDHAYATPAMIDETPLKETNISFKTVANVASRLENGQIQQTFRGVRGVPVRKDMGLTLKTDNMGASRAGFSQY